MQELSFYLTGLLIVSRFLAISVTLAPKLLDSLVKETNFNTINEKNPITGTLSISSNSFLKKLNLQTKTPNAENPPPKKDPFLCNH